MNLLLQRLHAYTACPPSRALPESTPPPVVVKAQPAARLLPLGRTVMTPGIEELTVTGEFNPAYVLARHQRGDWGDLEDCDRRRNDIARESGGRILSEYDLPCGKVWVLTEAENDDGVREVTTIMLPHEY